MRILVTGADGFVGSHLARKLAEDGQEVYGAVRRAEPLRRIGDLFSVTKVKVDLLDEEEVRKAVSEVQPEMAFHLAWYTVPGKFWHAPENLDCVSMTLSLARALAESGCRRLVAAGTCAEYDWAGETFDEEAPTRPHTLYGVCKNAARNVLNAYCEEAGMSFAWPRLFSIYGPEEAEDRLVPYIINRLLRGETAELTHGRQVRDLLYVGDLAEALAILGRSSLQGPVNIGSGQPVTLRAVAEEIARLLDLVPSEVLRFGARPASSAEPLSLVPDTRKLLEGTGWRPAHSLTEGLTKAVESWSQSREANHA